jgi:hypothetical protein
MMKHGSSGMAQRHAIPSRCSRGRARWRRHGDLGGVGEQRPGRGVHHREDGGGRKKAIRFSSSNQVSLWTR